MPRYRESCAAVVVAVALAAGVASSASAQQEGTNRETRQLPVPRGPAQVGTRVFHLVDRSRLAPDGSPRPVTVQAWYPAQVGPEASVRYVIDRELIDSMVAAEYYGLPPDVIRSWDTVRVRAGLNARLAVAAESLPVVVFSHGLGVARAHYTALVTELASAGFVVLAVDHPYGGMTRLPDGRVLTPAAEITDETDEARAARLASEWAADAEFVVREVSPGLGGVVPNRSRAAMMGHSLGGAAALVACRTIPRFVACANLDGAPFGTTASDTVGGHNLVILSRPMPSDSQLAARGLTRRQWDERGRARRDEWRAIAANARSGTLEVLTLAGSGHLTFSDAPFQFPTLAPAAISADRAHALVSDALIEFFRQQLAGTQLARSRSPRPPELEPLDLGR